VLVEANCDSMYGLELEKGVITAARPDQDFKQLVTIIEEIPNAHQS
jgi:hypothetical protein